MVFSILKQPGRRELEKICYIIYMILDWFSWGWLRFLLCTYSILTTPLVISCTINSSSWTHLEAHSGIHKKNYPSSILNSWDSYESDIKFRFGRQPWHHCNIYLSIFLLVSLKESYIQKRILLACFLEIAMENLCIKKNLKT